MSFLKANQHYQDLKPLQYDTLKMKQALYFKIVRIFQYDYDTDGRGRNLGDLLWALSEIPGALAVFNKLIYDLNIKIEQST